MTKVIKSCCPQNHPCLGVKLCPIQALSQDGFHAPEIDESKCSECGLCTRMCPYHAIVGIPKEYKEDYSALL